MADMNETGGYVRIDNETGSKIYPPTRPFFDIAKYLSERGFAVLQYDKKSIGENATQCSSITQLEKSLNWYKMEIKQKKEIIANLDQQLNQKSNALEEKLTGDDSTTAQVTSL
jgi:predicted Fe-S protein YdhL (DUF1289 family)